MTPLDIFKSKAFIFGALPLFVLYIWRYIHTKGHLWYADTKANQEILKRCPTILKNSFSPTIYLQHRLLQTMFASFIPSKTPHITYLIEEIDMKGGGHTSLAWAQNADKNASIKHPNVLVVVIPGLTGSVKDNYVKDMVGVLVKRGYKCVVYQPRFNGGRLILPAEGNLDILSDFKVTMDHIRMNDKNARLFGIGHSYGANLLVNYLGTNPGASNAFVGAISIANPYNLLLGENKMRRSIVDRIMTSFLQKTVENSKKDLADAIRFKLNLEELASFKSIREFDRNFTIKVYGYDTVEDYYWGISSARRVGAVKAPLLLLQAEDDPVVEAKAFVKEEIEKHENAILMMTPRGGHQGWVEGFFKLSRWYLKPVVEFVDAVVDTKNL